MTKDFLTVKIEHHPFRCNSSASAKAFFPTLSIRPTPNDITHFLIHREDSVSMAIYFSNEDKKFLKLFDSSIKWYTDIDILDGYFLNLRSVYDEKIIANGEQTKLKIAYHILAYGDNDCNHKGTYSFKRGLFEDCGDSDNPPTLSLNITYKVDSSQNCPVFPEYLEL